jgi:NAD(P)-dependent dehydrogenase (short-subunit alcohol dehydrogenase family)
MKDMTSTADAKRAVQEAIEELGGLDIILANAVCVVFFTSFFRETRRGRLSDCLWIKELMFR